VNGKASAKPEGVQPIIQVTVIKRENKTGMRESLFAANILDEVRKRNALVALVQ